MLNIYQLTNAVNENCIVNNREMLHEAFKNVLPIDEATFYGKSKEIEQIEIACQKCIDIARSSVGVNSMQFATAQRGIGEAIAKAFGFRAVTINQSILLMHPAFLLKLPTSSGCTLCRSAIFKYSDMATGKYKTEKVKTDRHHEAIKFSEASNYSMRMFIGANMFMDFGEYSMTAKEITAVILHEVGHNFYVSGAREITTELFGTLLLFLTPADLMVIIAKLVNKLLSDTIFEMLGEFDVTLPKPTQDAINVMYNSLGQILEPIRLMHGLTAPIENVAWLFKQLMSVAFIMFAMPINIIRNALRYDSEKYSDAFAASYGYSADLSSALFKLGHFRGNIEIGGNKRGMQNVLDFYRAIFRLPFDIIYFIFDCHPTTAARAINNLKYMKAARDSITDPTVLKEYDESLAQLERVMDDVKTRGGYNAVDITDKLKMFNAQFSFHGGDIRNIVSGLQPKITKYKNLDVTV